MGLCWDCDQEITFITVKGIARPIHESGHCGEYRKTARPAKCPECRQMVFFVEHNGGSVWFDELGPPWPKHGCFDSQTHDSGNTRVAPIPSVILSVTEKGALSVHGMGSFPVTLHREQWLKLLAQADAIRDFISKHDHQLKKT